MAKFFIHRPVFAIVISVIIVIAGIIAGLQLPIAQYPQIAPPSVEVSASYSGASASTVEQAIAQVIEKQVNSTQGMDYMSSTSNDDGTYNLKVIFNVGTDGDMDSVKVQNNVSAAMSSLPAIVQSNGVTTVKSSSDMSLVFALYCENGRFDRAFMKNYFDIYLLDEIQRVPGVGKVMIFAADYSLRIWINPERLNDYGLTVSDVINAIKQQNAQAAAGTIGAMPVNRGQEKQYTGKVQGRLTTPEEFEDIILKSGEGGAFTRLRDVARVEVGTKENNFISKYNGYPAIAAAVQLTSDANAMQAITTVKEILKNGEANFPEGIKYGQVLDNTAFISASINEVVHTFFEALVLVVVVIYVFLQSLRATIIPLLAVPVSLVGTFGAFIILDFTINTLTLFAMVLAIGLVVDDAIVVLENVEQHMEEGLGPVEATEVAMAEVQGPVVAIAFVLSAVFIPVAFLGGMQGVLYRQFALTIAVSMALSAFIALTLTPALCAMILKHKEKSSGGLATRFFDWFNRTFEWTKNRYVQIVASCIKHSKLAIIFMLIVCGLTGLLFKILPSTFVPDEDQGYYMTAVMLLPGTSMNHTIETMDKVCAAVREQVKGVKATIEINGYDILAGGAKSSSGTIFVGLEPWADRQAVETNISNIINNTMMVGFVTAPEATVVSVNPPALPGLGQVGGLSMELQDVSDHTDRELYEITNEIVAAANQRPEFSNVSTTFDITAPVYEYKINRERVEMLGVDLNDVYTALQVNFGGVPADDYNRFGRTYKVMVQSDVAFRSEIQTAKFIYVKGRDGQRVPLDTLIEPKVNTGSMQISRFNSKKAMTIQAQVGEGYSSGQAMEALEEVAMEKAGTVTSGNSGFAGVAAMEGTIA